MRGKKVSKGIISVFDFLLVACMPLPLWIERFLGVKESVMEGNIDNYTLNCPRGTYMNQMGHD